MKRSFVMMALLGLSSVAKMPNDGSCTPCMYYSDDKCTKPMRAKYEEEMKEDIEDGKFKEGEDYMAACWKWANNDYERWLSFGCQAGVRTMYYHRVEDCSDEGWTHSDQYHTANVTDCL